MEPLTDQPLRQWAEAEVDDVLDHLPDALREKALRVPVTLEPRPSPALVEDGIARDTLGLFTGAAFEDEEHTPMPPQIILFLDNLWAYANANADTFRAEVRTTFLHELGHYLGLDEEDLTERGLE